ncbi:biopolymer transporter Tol [Spirulina sp. CS-785/01]|uniref:TolB family protein n=1 Tax=Spirulina sp. CS-785/01 TaxID=3021716 RepID=UPI00232C465A|nr:biopolymer transporter Tol [Spirulina sp. CS-785/01]MDB9315403.1 biopolymer transporter Tol [Spirulina sp. CS-785/01]
MPAIGDRLIRAKIGQGWGSVSRSVHTILLRCIFLFSVSLLAACGNPEAQLGPVTLNSRYNDEQPAISGDGRLVAFVTNRKGGSEIAVYDLDENKFLDLPGLNPGRKLAQNPSLSRTGRYIVYVVNEQGRPAIALYDQAINQSKILTTSYRHWIRNPHISPDGRYVTFETSRRGQWDVEVFDRGPEVELDIADGTPITP